MCLVKALWTDSKSLISLALYGLHNWEPLSYLERTKDLNNVSIVILSLDAKVLSIHPANLEHLLLTNKICFSKLQSEDINIPRTFILSCSLIVFRSGLT